MEDLGGFILHKRKSIKDLTVWQKPSNLGLPTKILGSVDRTKLFFCLTHLIKNNLNY